jgi:multisubunit Na+/H+ antiporter MnhG subunit
MKVGIYNVDLSAQNRWERMQRRGFLLYVLQDTFIGISGGALTVLALAAIHQLPAPLSIMQVLGGATGTGVVSTLFAIFSWRSAKKKARTVGGAS